MASYRRYRGGSSDVLDYLAKRYNRGDQMQDLLHQFALIKQLKEERAEREREWGFKKGDQL